MKLLLDTQCWLWWFAQPECLSEEAIAHIADEANELLFIGFSAGGHLAGMTAAQPEQLNYKPIDDIDSISARPDFAALIYPVITMLPPFDKTHASKEIIGSSPTHEQQVEYSVELHVGRDMPKTFLAQALDDPISPVDNSILMFSSLRKAGVPAELHIFQSGGHGWGMGVPSSEVSEWSNLFRVWLTLNKFLVSASRSQTP